VAELIAKPYAKQRAALVDMQHAAQRDLPGEPAALNRRETTYLCVADESGMMVSLIQSNYTGFGSGYVIPELGFGLQDRGNLFDLHPGRPNSYAPGKRPFHTIIPAFLAFAIVPIGGEVTLFGHTFELQLADPPMGILFLLAMSGIAVYGVMLAGWSSGSKYPLLGSVRASAQMIS